MGIIAVLVLISVFPIEGNYQIKIVQSGSMEPALKTGSVVVVKPAGNYEIGDIVTFHGGFKLANGEEIAVSHRIVEKNVSESGEITYKTKGDANEDADHQELRESQIIGKVLFGIPYIGYVVESARQPYGFFAIVIIPAAIIVYDQAAAIWKEIKKTRAKRRTNLESEF